MSRDKQPSSRLPGLYRGNALLADHRCSIVFVNGIDDADGLDSTRRERQLQLLGDQFYDTRITIVDFFSDTDREISEGFLRAKAKILIARLCEVAKDHDIGVCATRWPDAAV